MPNRETHLVAGGVAGLLSSAHRARGKASNEQLLFVLGGTLSGALGGLLPDRIEPATSSWHRGPAHSLAAGGGISKLWENLDRWEEFCGTKYRHYQTLKMQTQDPIWRLLYFVAECIWGLLAGSATGALAGYLSHLGLDFFTPRCLPLIA
jgi:hypothetical protein